MHHEQCPERPYRPGDVFLNRYMPDTTEEEREAARENLKNFAAVMLRVFTRMAKEDQDQAQESRREQT